MALFISTYARVGLLQKAGSRVANYGAFDHRKQSSRGCFSAHNIKIYATTTTAAYAYILKFMFNAIYDLLINEMKWTTALTMRRYPL